MIVPINNNFSPLPFYDVSDAGVSNELKNKYLNSEKPYAYGEVFDLPIDGGWLMPFQFTVNFEVSRVGGCYVIPLSNPLANTQAIINTPIIMYDQNTGSTTILFYGEHHPTLVQGRAYIEVELFDTVSVQPHVYMSDLFSNLHQSVSNVKPVPDGFIRLEYTGDHYLRYNGGKIYLYDQKFGFDLLIDTTIAKPSYTFEEKTSDRLGYRYIESQVSNKSYGFTFVAPEYLCDALRLLPMCNRRVITDKWHKYEAITDVNVDVEWLEQGNLARVTITFNNDTVIANLAEYVSVAPQRLNTSLPVPPTPEVTLPRVSVNSVVDIQQTEATIEAEVESNGHGTLTERGLCWSMSGTPTIGGSHSSDSQAELGQYAISVVGLQSGTIYYCRAYAINEAGVAYSDTLTFETLPSDVMPSVLTYSAQNVSDSSADVSGSVVDEGTQPVLRRGIVVSSTNQNPHIDDNDVVAYLNTGQGLGSFIQTLSNLTPSTTYYYAAFASSNVGTSYGQVMSFTTLGSPVEPATVITDTAVRNLTSSSATVGGTVVNSGGGSISERGVCLSTGSTPTISDIRVADAQAIIGTFYVNAQNLIANTTYYFAAYAINEAVVSYGSVHSFTTLDSATTPTVEVTNYTSDSNSIHIDANLVGNGGSAITSKGFIYSLSQDMSNAIVASPTQEYGSLFSADISGLMSGTVYYCQAFATNAEGTGYSGIVAIITKTVAPRTPSVNVSQLIPDVSQRAQTFDAEVTSDGGSAVTEQGVCWSNMAQPTIGNNSEASATTGVGSYQVRVDSSRFLGFTRVYYRAYAISSAGVGYSETLYFDMSSSTPEEESTETSR